MGRCPSGWARWAPASTRRPFISNREHTFGPRKTRCLTQSDNFRQIFRSPRCGPIACAARELPTRYDSTDACMRGFTCGHPRAGATRRHSLIAFGAAISGEPRVLAHTGRCENWPDSISVRLYCRAVRRMHGPQRQHVNRQFDCEWQQKEFGPS